MSAKNEVVLVLNSGSSSLKFQIYRMAGEETLLAKGLVERIGLKEPVFNMKRQDGRSIEESPQIHDHLDAIKLVSAKLTDPDIGVLASLSEVTVIGHRVVHGGETFHDAAVVTDEVIKAIQDCIPLAPLHNPPNLTGIEACRAAFPGVPNVAVFDTAFHHSMPPSSYLYAIPYEYYKDYGIRKYGFHGTSHKYVAEATAKYLRHDLSNLRLITCHLGNGSSITAIDRGKVVDTSMGMTPLPGLIMGTRCGDIDPAVVLYLMRQGMSVEDINKLLNKKSGLLGVAGIGSGDMRDVIEAEEKGNEQASRALCMFVQRLISYIGSYYTILHGAHALVFTGGIGENSSYIRARVVKKLAELGCQLDETKNQVSGKPAIVSDDRSTLKAIVMPTNEELMIARDTVRVLREARS
ncbi:MAG TPA: acetate kinase [Verrucomicrobia bacterium]|nr:MAG: acetate kinase [Lentisphaerae bacterium GWF2_57_35]HBA83869.1 acetate kinase [Verrucomicrobiota bacterium]